MSSNTETVIAPVSVALSSLSVGALVEISLAGSSSQAFVLNVPASGVSVIASASGVPSGAVSTFLITMYAFNGTNQAKISLQPLGTSSFLAAGQNAAGLTFPIVLGQEPGQFLLTDLGDGTMTIQNTFAPPGPFIHGRETGINVWTYGFAQPLVQGSFNITLVG